MNRLLDALLAPLTRLLVARGVLFAEASQGLKRHYVRAAQGLAGAKATDSRISVMTGLQRRDVVVLRAPLEPAAKPAVLHLSRLVARWLTDPKFAGRDLPRKGEGSFDLLAQSIRRDVHPKTMLTQLCEAGTAVLTAEGQVHLAQTSYQPRAGGAEQLDYLATNGGDFLKAAVANILTDPPPFFERAVHYNQLSVEAVASLDAEFRAGQMALLLAINTRAARLQRTMPGNRRFRAGGYFYAEEEPE